MSTLAEIEAAVESLPLPEQKAFPENDLWIAALARQHAQPLLSRDAHFDKMPGLRRVGW